MKEVCLLMLVLLLCACSPALAKTPKDMLVMAGHIDEIITLRLHLGGMQAKENVIPDLTTIGKIRALSVRSVIHAPVTPLRIKIHSF